jgi:DNA-binding transcriptional ArsR family regulator
MLPFTALADPTRRAMLEHLLAGERTAGALAVEFDISGPAVSQHLKVLREARLVQVRIDAQRRIYSLNPAGFDEAEAWLAHMRSYWSRRLDALEHELTRATTPATRRRAKKEHT